MTHTANSETTSPRILLGHLNSSGDCLYATTVARQIKVDYPNCHLTWAIGSMCRSVIEENPHVDEIWEFPLYRIEDAAKVWNQFIQEATTRKHKGDFDEIFFTQFSPCNYEKYDGLIRSSTFRGYPKPISVPIAPVLRLTSDEVERVRLFSETHQLAHKHHVILFECSPKSDQSFVNPDFALDVAEKLVEQFADNICVILSSNLSINSKHPNIIDGSKLSLRENGELTKYCTLFIGCSSGITWICTSDWAKPLPMVQLLKANPIWYASVVGDYKCWGLPTDTVMEMTECDSNHVKECVSCILQENFALAKSKFHQDIAITFNSYGHLLRTMLLKRQFRKAQLMITHHIERNGFQKLLKWHISSLGNRLFLSKIIRKLRRVISWTVS